MKATQLREDVDVILSSSAAHILACYARKRCLGLNTYRCLAVIVSPYSNPGIVSVEVLKAY